MHARMEGLTSRRRNTVDRLLRACAVFGGAMRLSDPPSVVSERAGDRSGRLCLLYPHAGVSRCAIVPIRACITPSARRQSMYASEAGHCILIHPFVYQAERPRARLYSGPPLIVAG